jgi:hypothetical protein
MSSRLAFTLLLSVACLPLVQAADEATPAHPPKAPPYVLKHRSAFQPLGDDERAPFWPIGWTKRKMVAGATEPVRAVEVPRVTLDQGSFKVSSILLGNPSLAIINGRTYSEGEYLRVPKTTGATAPTAAVPASARVRVYRINDGAVVLQNQDQMITVALARPELLQRSSVEDLLREDRP